MRRVLRRLRLRLGRRRLQHRCHERGDVINPNYVRDRGGWDDGEGGRNRAGPTANEKDYTWEYVYSPKAQSFTVTYVDDTTGEELTDHDFTLSGVTDRSYAKTLASDKWDYAAAGYVLDTDQNATDPLSELSGTFGAQNAGVTVYLTHQTSTTTQTQTITRTINYLDPTTKELTSLTQTAELTRTVEEDLVTGAKTYSQWTTDT